MSLHQLDFALRQVHALRWIWPQLQAKCKAKQTNQACRWHTQGSDRSCKEVSRMVQAREKWCETDHKVDIPEFDADQSRRDMNEPCDVDDIEDVPV